MLMPKKVKFRKSQRGRMKGLSKGARTFEFGSFGLLATEPCWMTSQQIESMRMTISRRIKKEGKLFLRVFPDKPVSKKPLETRMGKGKGNPELWVAVVKRGRIICELSDVTEDEAKEILRVASHKLPIKTKFIKKGFELL
ncbi:50S ribosomal protein L16 [Candidatus Dependentiae bacterium]|nr:50S ribosomal protein L16 [Candidatus Dependentiae bacterium]